jgi:hypothetical protein
MVRHPARKRGRPEAEPRARKPVLERRSSAYRQKKFVQTALALQFRRPPVGSHSGAAECPRRRGRYEPARVVGNRETPGSSLDGSSVPSEIRGKSLVNRLSGAPARPEFSLHSAIQARKGSEPGEDGRRARNEGERGAPVEQDERYSKDKNYNEERKEDAK